MLFICPFYLVIFISFLRFIIIVIIVVVVLHFILFFRLLNLQFHYGHACTYIKYIYSSIDR